MIHEVPFTSSDNSNGRAGTSLKDVSKSKMEVKIGAET